MTVAPSKPNPIVAAVREVRGQWMSGLSVAPLGDGLVWDRSQTGFIAANNPEIYFYDHRADMSGNGTINDADFFILQDMVGTGNNLGDSLE